MHPQFSQLPLSKEVWGSDEYSEWCEHMNECTNCGDWNLEQTIIKRGHKVSDYPCVHIAYHVTTTCEDHPNPWECPDILLVKKNNDYGLPIRDGGTSYVKIQFCPWCGVKI